MFGFYKKGRVKQNDAIDCLVKTLEKRFLKPAFNYIHRQQHGPSRFLG